MSKKESKERTVRQIEDLGSDERESRVMAHCVRYLRKCTVAEQSRIVRYLYPAVDGVDR